MRELMPSQRRQQPRRRASSAKSFTSARTGPARDPAASAAPPFDLGRRQRTRVSRRGRPADAHRAWKRSTASTTRRVTPTVACAGTCHALFDGLGEGAAPRADALARAAGRASRASASTRGASTTAWSTGRGGCSRSRAPIATRARHGVMEDVLARLPRERDLRSAPACSSCRSTRSTSSPRRRARACPRGAARLLMMPDLCHHWLCGSMTGERTNASTTQLLDARTRHVGRRAVRRRSSSPARLMPELVAAGARARRASSPTCGSALAQSTPCVSSRPATHDTASAVAGTPLRVGLGVHFVGHVVARRRRARRPRSIDAQSRAANFTNEAGVDGTVRFLKNVMGLWMLESCRKEWRRRARTADLDDAARARARRSAGPAGFIDPDAPRFFHPPSMTREVLNSLTETGQTAPDDPGR